MDVLDLLELLEGIQMQSASGSTATPLAPVTSATPPAVATMALGTSTTPLAATTIAKNGSIPPAPTDALHVERFPLHEAPRERSHSPPPHVPILPLLREPHRVAARPSSGFAALSSPFSRMPDAFQGVNSVAGALCWRALVGRDRSSSLAGSHVFMMTGSELEDVAMAARHADRIIRAIRDRRHRFYVGITRDPARRWEQHQARNSSWSHMTVVVEARDSVATSTVEMQTLVFWRGDPLCLNRSSGGESATPGSPHYVYVLESLR